MKIQLGTARRIPEAPTQVNLSKAIKPTKPTKATTKKEAEFLAKCMVDELVSKHEASESMALLKKQLKLNRKELDNYTSLTGLKKALLHFDFNSNILKRNELQDKINSARLAIFDYKHNLKQAVLSL